MTDSFKVRGCAAILLVTLLLACGTDAPTKGPAPGSADATEDGSTSGAADASAGDLWAELSAALDEAPGPATEAAVRALIPVLGAADWSYLENADWPDDPTLVLGDARLQRALAPFVREQPEQKAVTGFGSQQLSPAELAELKALLERARQILEGHHGSATLVTPACVAAFCQALGKKLTPPLPSAGPPADAQASQQVITFYGNSQSRVEEHVTPLCCRGVVTWPSGKLVCLDATSCRGRGEPAPGGITLGSTPSPTPCAQRFCGPDGLGGSCGTCAPGSACDANGQCVAAAVATCCDVNGGGIAVSPCLSGLYVKCRGGATPPGACTPVSPGQSVDMCCPSSTGETCAY